MIFHSLAFVVFFLVVVLVYWRLTHRAQNLLLLGASYIFYGWMQPWFVLVMLASTTVDFWAGQRMEDDPNNKKRYLAASLIVNLGMLGFFKYFNFFIENVQAGFAALGISVGLPTLAIVLPAGISFYTFQALSYTIDIYKGEMHARRDAVSFALFVAFFPHLVAGPIMRAQNLLVQVERPRTFSEDAARSGLVLMAWGFFKKLVVADNVAIIANRVFAHDAPTFEVLWAGVFAFGIQIYADFSAYSDIARGVARWFGFELVVNFDHPYIAHSPTNFWRRWHISLSTWFRDYVYIPLGGNRVPALQREINLIATFVISGLWHGASWNFVLWGFYHGMLVFITRTLGRLLRLPEHWPGPLFLVQVAGTFVLTMGGWLFFRETNPDYLMAFLHLRPRGSTALERELGIHLFVLALTWAIPLIINDIWTLGRERWTWFNRTIESFEDRVTVVGAQALTVGTLAALTLVLRSNVTFDFIYFQF
jgi:D-alanyl-lipoteichoic acid acyltransferase DltB (MBOAT superfamily)